jgi:hypothetical protein
MYCNVDTALLRIGYGAAYTGGDKNNCNAPAMEHFTTSIQVPFIREQSVGDAYEGR